MEYYVDQLEAVLRLVKLLNDWDNDNASLMIKQPIKLVHPMEPDVVLGELVDEIGGAWAFSPFHPTDEMLKKFRGES